jgi:threonine aldolase
MIDLRSDTVTRPTAGMLRAMLAAKLGDDVLGDDETVIELENHTAHFFGKEAGLFFPSGTMANQVAIKTHVQPGEEVICDQTAHIYNYEGGGIAANCGASVRLILGERGIFTAQEVALNVNDEDIHFPRTKLVSIENTVNRGGGACWGLEEIASVSQMARKHGLAVHLDGARVWNAMVAKGYSGLQLGNSFDSISVCFSKGMGCPVGSVLLGSNEFIYEAKRHRKRMGGGMRQSGILAAACLYALENHLSLLATDHLHAKMVADCLAEKTWVAEILPVETNLINFKLKNPDLVQYVLAQLKLQNVLASATGVDRIRFAMHLDISENMVEKLIQIIRSVEAN